MYFIDAFALPNSNLLLLLQSTCTVTDSAIIREHIDKIIDGNFSKRKINLNQTVRDMSTS